MERRPRRKHNDEFKKGAVEMVTKQGYTISKAARALDLHDAQLRDWLDRLAPDWRTQRAGLAGARRSSQSRSCASCRSSARAALLIV